MTTVVHLGAIWIFVLIVNFLIVLLLFKNKNEDELFFKQESLRNYNSGEVPLFQKEPAANKNVKYLEIQISN